MEMHWLSLYSVTLDTINCMLLCEYFTYHLQTFFFAVYRLQLEAPVPLPIISDKVPPDLPEYLGRDYHGCINHLQAANLLKLHPDGAYLVRNSECAKGQFHTLSLK